ncbi:MAG: His/Gly/Thr/Pro-type tRNA ligase C-terminal domain-containing protein, partial [Nostoc sp.]
GDRLGKQIRNAEKEKIPVMAVVGAKEVETNTLSIRTRASGDLGSISVDQVVDKLQEAIANFDNLQIDVTSAESEASFENFDIDGTGIKSEEPPVAQQSIYSLKSLLYVTGFVSYLVVTGAISLWLYYTGGNITFDITNIYDWLKKLGSF